MTAAVGVDATKHRFLYELSNSTVIHISTFTSIERGKVTYSSYTLYTVFKLKINMFTLIIEFSASVAYMITH